LGADFLLNRFKVLADTEIGQQSAKGQGQGNPANTLGAGQWVHAFHTRLVSSDASRQLPCAHRLSRFAAVVLGFGGLAGSKMFMALPLVRKAEVTEFLFRSLRRSFE
jgi:hypothetical protein